MQPILDRNMLHSPPNYIRDDIHYSPAKVLRFMESHSLNFTIHEPYIFFSVGRDPDEMTLSTAQTLRHSALPSRQHITTLHRIAIIPYVCILLNAFFSCQPAEIVITIQFDSTFSVCFHRFGIHNARIT